MVGARYRELSPKHLQLAAFCSGRPEGEALSAQLKAWNAAHPKWRYGQVTNFGRDRSRARQRLLAPNYRLPVPEEQSDGK
jgi:hypothetical protein